MKTSAERFSWWAQERHRMYLRRSRGESGPWTDDQTLRDEFFTCPYRENDRVTRWFRERVRGPLRDDPRALFATVAFRWFNLPSTCEVLTGGRGWDDRRNLLTHWDSAEAERRLTAAKMIGTRLFTGAYISCQGLPAAIAGLTEVWRRREKLLGEIRERNSIEATCKLLTSVKGVGQFTAYEIATDLRHTHLLRSAVDVDSWVNPGPGSVRGLYRLLGWDLSGYSNTMRPPVPRRFQEYVRELLAWTRHGLAWMPRMEARDVEHSLCEFDKYERLRAGDGRGKRRFSGRDQSGPCPRSVLLVGERMNQAAPDHTYSPGRWLRLSAKLGAFRDEKNRVKLQSVGVDVDDPRMASLNLTPPAPQGAKWGVVMARDVAELIDLSVHHTVYLCGSRVAKVFNIPYEVGSVNQIGKTRVVVLPHPSGLCRFWNSEIDVSELRKTIINLMERPHA